MKKTLFFIAVLFCGFVGKSQIWFDLGVKGGFTPGMSINPNVFNNEDYQLGFAPSYLFGGKVGINFNSEHALNIDILATTINNARKLKLESGEEDFNLKLNYLEIPILYRFNQENGSYSEIGPQFAIFQGAELNGNDVKNQFVGTNYGIAVGLGQYIGGGNLFGLNLGFRMAYMFNDIVATDFQTDQGNAVYAPTNAENLSDFKYKASNNFYAGIIAEFNFNFGYLVKGSGCHKNTRFKLF